MGENPMRIVVLDGCAANPGDLSWDALRALGETVIYDRTPTEEIVPRAGRGRGAHEQMPDDRGDDRGAEGA